MPNHIPMFQATPELLLQERLIAFCEHESEAVTQQAAARFVQRIEQRVSSGYAVRALRFKAEASDVVRDRFVFACETNASRLRPGDTVVLSRECDNVGMGDGAGAPETLSDIAMDEDPDVRPELVPRTEYAFVVKDVSLADEIVLTVNHRNAGATPDQLADTVFVCDQGTLNLWRFVAGVLRGLAHHPHLAKTCARIDAGDVGLETLDAERERLDSERSRFGRHLDPSQRDAFALACAAKRGAVLIQGPPGTGKTRVLAAVALELASRGLAVGVVAFTNHAVDNIVDALRAIDNAGVIPVARIRGKPGRRPHVSTPTRFNQLPDPHGWVVCATAHTTLNAQNKLFDVMLLDEASQLPQPLAIGAMLAASRWVLVGDHRQMSPVLLHRHHEADLVPSLFEHLQPVSPSRMLEVCRRMNASLIAYSSERWYGGRVHAHESVAARSLALEPAPDPSTWLDVALDPAHPGVVVEVQHTGCSQVCAEEARAAVALLARAHERGVAWSDMVVVTPYRRQERELRSHLSAMAGSLAAERVRIETVERIQGQEAALVILSLCSSEPAGSLTEHHLNVALTRAQAKRVVLGAPAVLVGGVGFGAWACVAALAARDKRVRAQ